MYDFTRLVDRLDNIHMSGDTVIGTDVPDDYEHDMTMVYALMAATEKPLWLSFRKRENISPALQIFDLASGGEGAFLNKPSVIFGGYPIVSPLRFGKENLEVMIDATRLGLVSDIAAAAIQVGIYYDLPNSVGAGMTDSKIPDAQYGYKKGLTIALAALSRAHRVCEVGGIMGSLMGYSFESMVIDNEAVGMIQRTVRGIEISDDTLSVETIHQCAVDPGHFWVMNRP